MLPLLISWPPTPVMIAITLIDLKDNVYAYGRATFDWLNQNVPYDYGAGVQARSGEICLVDGLGDCDEQSNAFMSIMRVKGVPTWYAFGALTDRSTYTCPYRFPFDLTINPSRMPPGVRFSLNSNCEVYRFL